MRNFPKSPQPHCVSCSYLPIGSGCADGDFCSPSARAARVLWVALRGTGLTPICFDVGSVFKSWMGRAERPLRAVFETTQGLYSTLSFVPSLNVAFAAFQLCRRGVLSALAKRTAKRVSLAVLLYTSGALSSRS